MAIVVQMQPWAKIEQREGAMLAEASEVVTSLKIHRVVESEELPVGEFQSPIDITVDSYIDSQYLVERGFVCQSERDIKCLNGICGNDEWAWHIVLNGDSQNTSLNSTVSPGDALELVYKKKTPEDHQRLQDWLLSYGTGR